VLAGPLAAEVAAIEARRTIDLFGSTPAALSVEPSAWTNGQSFV
jgi:hypothetical protein